MYFNTEIGGIPCTVEILSWEPYRPATITSDPWSSSEADGGYGEYILYDSSGILSEELKEGMTEQDEEKLQQEMFSIMEIGNGW